MRSFRYVVVDVFTDTPLAGNQLAVFTDARGLADDEMQRLARETNFSETTFVLPAEADGHALLTGLGLERSELPVELYDNGMHHVYVGFGSEDELAALRPDLSAFTDAPAVLGINCFAGSGTRWKTRMLRSGGPRRCTPAPTARRRRWSASRSAAAP